MHQPQGVPGGLGQGMRPRAIVMRRWGYAVRPRGYSCAPPGYGCGPLSSRDHLEDLAQHKLALDYHHGGLVSVMAHSREHAAH